MPLQDHFHPPLSVYRHWHAFHNAWATYLSSQINQKLPEGFFAEPNVQFDIEIDVATWEKPGESGAVVGRVPNLWTPPPAKFNIPVTLNSETVEINIFNREAGPILAGAIELVSPGNKDRPEHREAFVSKCAAYLQNGVGLIVVDVVTARQANLHGALLGRVSASSAPIADAELYAVAYRPLAREGRPTLDIWPESLTLGAALPTLPLWLRGDVCIPVDFDAAYERTCQEQRVRAEGA